MKEIVKIYNEKSILDIKGGKYDSALFLNKELIQFTFLREVGSTWRYQIAKGINSSDIINNTKFSNFVRYGVLTSERLSDQFKYILDFLVTGEYQIEYTNLDANIQSVEMNDTSDNYFHFDSYGGLTEVIETQSKFDKKLVSDYMQIIKSGQKPIVILLKTHNSENTFIIDGHHKFFAYGQLKMDVQCLLITRLDSPKIDRQEAVGFIEEYGPKNHEYKNRFLERVAE